MIPGEIVYQGISKKGKQYSIRYLRATDAPLLYDYINTLSAEHTFIRFQGEQVTLEDEQKYTDNQVQKIREKKLVDLVVFSENKLIGKCEIGLSDKTEKHIGNMGITIAKDYRSEGIGKRLLQTAISEASNNLTGLRIITLGCFANNTLARSLYAKLGFIEYGVLPEGLKQGDNYIDHIFMYMRIR